MAEAATMDEQSVSIEQTSRASEGLLHLAQILQNVISRFKI